MNKTTPAEKINSQAEKLYEKYRKGLSKPKKSSSYNPFAGWNEFRQQFLKD